MKTLTQLIANVRAIEAEFKAAPDEKLEHSGYTKAENKYLAAIVKAETALALYQPKTPEELFQKVEAMMALGICADAFSLDSSMKAWRTTILRDIAVLLPSSAARKAA